MGIKAFSGVIIVFFTIVFFNLCSHNKNKIRAMAYFSKDQAFLENKHPQIDKFLILSRIAYAQEHKSSDTELFFIYVPAGVGIQILLNFADFFSNNSFVAVKNYSIL